MITEKLTFWDEVARKNNWREYILPGRNSKQFEHEGYQQALLFSKIVHPESLVIDYGCGIGRVSKYLKLWYEKVIGIDVSKEFIKKAKKQNRRIRGLSFYTVDEFSGRSEVANLVICLMVLQHNTSVNRQKIIEHIHYLLKPGGMALISFPRIESRFYKETSFVHKFTRHEVREYGKAFSHYEVIKGNLAAYKENTDPKLRHEYFLKAFK